MHITGTPGLTDATFTAAIEQLQDIMLALQATIDDGVPLLPTDIEALQQVTATVMGMPTDYPDAAANVKLADIQTRLGTINNSLGMLHTDNAILSDISTTATSIDSLLDTTNALLSGLPTAVQTDALTNTQLRAAPVPVSGTVTVSNPTALGLTDTQLRASAVPVSNTAVTDGSQQTKVGNGFITADIVDADNNAIPAAITTKTTTVSFVSANTQLPAGTGLNTDGYDTIEYVGMSGSVLLQPQWSNDGVNWVSGQWFRWTDVSGPLSGASSFSQNSRSTCKVVGHYFRLAITTFTSGPANVDIILSSKPFVPPVQKVTFDGAAQPVSISGTLSTSDRGASGTPNPVVAATSAATFTVKASNANRKEVIIVNGTAVDLYLLLAASGTVASTLYSIKLAPGGQHIEDKYTGLITGILASGTGNIMVTEIT